MIVSAIYQIRPVPKRRPTFVGCLCPPGGKDGVTEDSNEAA
jgi:hypothetical protein